ARPGRPRPRVRPDQARSAGRPPRGPRRPPREGGGGAGALLQQPAARLLVAVAAIAILIVVIALVVRDCRRSQLVDSYRGYVVEGVTPIAAASAQQGKQLVTVLANAKGSRAEVVQNSVKGIVREAEKLVTRAEDLNPPDKMDDAHRNLVTALKYRVNGLTALAGEIPNAVKSNDVADASARISQTMQRLVASDVIYQDSFEGPAKQALKDDDISDVEVPASIFLPGNNTNGAGPTGARRILNNLKRTGGASSTTTPGSASGLHGTGLVSVKVLPSGKDLANGQVNEVRGDAQLQWQVTIENGGDFVENGITVKATLSSPSGAPQRSEEEVASIDPKAQESVTLDVGQPPAFGENATLTIEVEAVEGETRTANNTAQYTVKFLIG
ncbi:MAG: hypothetical protein AB1416_11310, partial [Actinomycetota bacterium]